MANPIPIAGSGGRIIFAGTSLNFRNLANLDDYSIDPTIDLEEVTNFESPQVQNLINTLSTQFAPVHKESIIGCALACSVKLAGFWDAGNQPQNMPFNMQSGAKLFNVYVYTNKQITPYIFGILNCGRTSIKGNAKKGRVEFSFEAETNGAWTYPQ